MFIGINTAPPYGESGLTGREWREIAPRHVPITELIATKPHLTVAGLAPDARTAHDADRLIHVVRYGGRLFLEDGHHRVVRERLAGADWVNARVLDLDGRPGPVAAPVEEDPFVSAPGLVWVEGKGWRSVHLARALQSAGGRVDWHRWSPGTSDRERANWQDVA